MDSQFWDQDFSFKKQRKNKVVVDVGGVKVGGDNPVVVQSMTNTDTADVEKTVEQIVELYNAGSEIVRVTVNNDDAAKAIAPIREKIVKLGYDIPLVGCFHYNGHKLLTEHPQCAEFLDKYRINPGNVGFGEKKEYNFSSMIETAMKYDKAVRIGVNWGSLDQSLLTSLMDRNSQSSQPKDSSEILRMALVESTLTSARQAEALGLPKNKIILSCKVSRSEDLVVVYEQLAAHSDYALHLGLTEAGMGHPGIVSSTAALAILLNKGIGDTIRVSLTPKVGESRCVEVQICQEILQSLNFRRFKPQITACPGCGRTTSSFFQELAENIEKFVDSNMPEWKKKYMGVESLKVAVMGCIVNGPGESKHADIGISLPGTGEQPVAPVFIDGEKATTLRGENIDQQFMGIVETYIEQRYGNISL